MRLSATILIAGVVFAAVAIGWAGSRSTTSPVRRSSPPGNSSSDNQGFQNCLTIAEAQQHVGKTNCIKGTVVHVEEGHNGVTFLDFCTDYRSCPFTVVVFRADLRAVGDVRQLQGRDITIKGRIEEYDDRAEIVLRHARQLGGSASLLTALPKDYDVERQGHYSAGSFRPTKARKAKHRSERRSLSLEDPEEP